jgi:hypothetical protein
MTMDKDKMIKISVFVGEERAGGMIATSSNYHLYERLVDAIKNSEEISVLSISHGDPVYKPGTVFNKKAGKFFATRFDTKKINDDEECEAFHVVGDTSVLYSDILDKKTFPGIISAYQSSPTFTIEELDNVRFK